MSALTVMIKPASGNCNMKCDYCFYCDEMKNRKIQNRGLMTEETLKNVIRKTLLQADTCITYVFQGGEPLLIGIDFYEKVIELQKKYNKNHIRIYNSLQTNGTLLDDKWCDFFLKNNFLIGVSVDGIESIHNKYRHTADGKDTYDIVVKNIALLEKYRVEYNVLTVVTEAVEANIKEIYREYKKRGWRYQQYIECLDPLGEAWGSSQYSLKPEELGNFLIDLFELWYEDWKKGEQPYIRKFENYFRLLSGYMPEACDQKGVCSAQIVVEADGSVYPCDFYMTDKYCLGNFNQVRLLDIDKKRLEIGFIEESEKISNRCIECSYYKLCRGGCHRSRIFDVEEGRYYSYFCKGYQKFFACCLEKMKKSII